MHGVPKAVNVWQYNPAVQFAGCVGNQFSRERRIVKTDDFSSVFRLRPKYRTAHFVLYAKENDYSQARLGIVVAKRLAPRAVTRNAVKRICREVFRKMPLPAMDFIVRLTGLIAVRDKTTTNALSRRQVREELHQLFTSQIKERR